MLNMSIYPLKSHFYFLQIRSIPTITLKPVALKSKTQKTRVAISSRKEREEQSVIALLKKYDFTDTHIAIIGKKRPRILRCNAESILEPKLKFFNEIGFVGSLLPDLLVGNPIILGYSLVDRLIPNYVYLRELMKIDEATTAVVVRKASLILCLDHRKVLQPNIKFLLGEGIPMSSILKLLTSQPSSLLHPLDRIRDAVATIREYRAEPSENMFVHVFWVVMSMSESKLKKKVGILKSLGWSDKDIASTMARQPLCFLKSEEKLRSTFEYFVKTMHLKPEDVISNPIVCMFSLDKRIIPRYKVIMALKEKNLQKGLHITTILCMNEDKFTKKFILKHPIHSSSLWNLYRGAVPVNYEIDEPLNEVTY